MSKTIIMSLLVLAASAAMGMLAEKVFRQRLLALARKSRLKSDDIIIGALRGMILLWFMLAGSYIGLRMVFAEAGWMNMVSKFLVVAAIFSVTIVAIRIAAGMIESYSASEEALIPSISIFSNLTKVLVLIIGFLIILQYLGISITPILTALGVGGLAVALALQDTLANIFSGIHILVSRQIKPGDYIQLDSGEAGFVDDINWRSTNIRMMSNNMVLIPNSRLASAIVINHELPGHEMSVLVEIGVSYGSDLEHVERTVSAVAREVMNEVPGGVPEYEPLVRFHTFGESSIDFTVIMRTQSFPDQYRLKHEFIKRVHKRFDEEGIEIPFPIRTVHLEQES